MEKITLNGSYHNKPLNIFVSKTNMSVNSITIFVHGLYGTFDPTENTDKVNMLVKRLTNEDITHCINYNSSRDFQYALATDYDKRNQAFKEKTFLQELNDLKIIVDWTINNSERVFGIKKNNLTLNIHGNSLGGTLAVLLNGFFPMINKISLCGSGCGTNESVKPILSTHFKEDDILKSVSLYSGKLLLLQGSEDTTVPRESGMKILDRAIYANKQYVIVPGANHNFSKIDGKENGEAKKRYVNAIFDFISKM